MTLNQLVDVITDFTLSDLSIYDLDGYYIDRGAHRRNYGGFKVVELFMGNNCICVQIDYKRDKK